MGYWRSWLGGLGLGRAAPAAWHDEYKIIDRLIEYFYDQINLSRDITSRRWWNGYYTTPIPKENTCEWIEKHKGSICQEKLDLARKIYGYKG